MTDQSPLAALFSPFTEKETPAMSAVKTSPPEDSAKLIMPVPDDAKPLSTVRHKKYGVPTNIYPWYVSDSEVAFCTLRFEWTEEGKREKAVLPLTWWEVGPGNRRWLFKAPGKGRPLYNLPLIHSNPDWPVLVVEGEKTAEAATTLFPAMVATTTMGGSGAAHLSDFSPLAGRTVIIAADLDTPGEKYAQAVTQLAQDAGAKEVLRLRCEDIARMTVADGMPVARHAEVKEGWDLADALEEGWTADLLHQTFAGNLVAPVTANDNQRQVAPTANPLFRTTATALQRRIEDEEGNVHWETVCSRIEVIGMARDSNGRDWNIVVVMLDPDGREHRLLIPFADLATDTGPAISRLASLGLKFDPTTKAKRYLMQYLGTTDALRRILVVERIGWHNDVYVLPNRHFGPSGDEGVEFISEANHATVFTTKGTLEEWQRLASLAVGNSRLVLALSTAFAGPLLRPLGVEGGGFHFVGESSKGKTTTLYLAGSVWGGGTQSGFIDSWRTTDNALEGLALNRNDALLLLDEMGQIDGKALANSAYMLVNGQGKGRADRTGQRREPKRWQLIFLSTGEVGLTDKVTGETGARVFAGQQVRLVDISADPGCGLGLFEELHGFPSAKALAEHITATSLSVYGVAAEAFLAELTANVTAVVPQLRGFLGEFVAEHCPAEADSQVKRVASRFALAAAAGELAVAFGVLPWPNGTATEGAARCFQDWLANRGGIGAAEVEQGVGNVIAALHKHGSRFDIWDGHHVTEGPRDRLGWKRKNRDGLWEYYATPEGYREMCGGIDHKLVSRTLIERGLLKPANDGRASRSVAVPGHPKLRLYVLCPGAIEETANA